MHYYAELIIIISNITLLFLLVSFSFFAVDEIVFYIVLSFNHEESDQPGNFICQGDQIFGHSSI